MKLEPVSLGAAPTLLVDEAAALGIALPDSAAHGRGDPARSRRRVRVRDAAAGSGGPAETLRLEPFEFLGNDALEDCREVAAGDLGAHQRLEPFELLAQLVARRELDLVATGGERLDPRRGSERRGG
jgi:hypothetical protein